MSWEKVGKSLVGVLAVLVLVIMGFVLTRGDARLQAYLTYDSLTYPTQFSARISAASEQLKYDVLSRQVQRIGAGALDQDQVAQLVEVSQAPFRQMFAKPFEAGLVDHRTALYIDLNNASEQTVRDIHIRLPAKGLVQVRNDAGDDEVHELPTSAVDIPEITPGGSAKVWVYFDSDYSEIRQGSISIRDAEGKAYLHVYRAFTGLDADVAQYRVPLLWLLGCLLAGVLGLACLCLTQRRRLHVSGRHGL